MAKHRRKLIVRSHRLAAGQLRRTRGIALAVIVVASVIVGILWYASAANPGASADIAGTSGGKYAPAGHVPAASSRAGRTSPRRSGPPASRLHLVRGASVTAIGDSVMVASTPALQQALPGIYVDAQVGRQFYTGLSVIASLKAAGQLRRIVVVALGTNGTVTAAEVSQLFAEIGHDRRLVLVNTYEARSWEAEVNSTLAGAARTHPDVVLANWYAAISRRTYLLWSDGIHPQPAGGVMYARMLKAAVERVAGIAPLPLRSPRIR